MITSLQGKMRVLESDLESAEDQLAEKTAKLNEADAELDDARRNNQQLQRQIDTLESKFW